MILPIYAYGGSILRKESEEIERDYPELNKLIDDMSKMLSQGMTFNRRRRTDEEEAKRTEDEKQISEKGKMFVS
jgi:uncharacterized caspase-like protein